MQFRAILGLTVLTIFAMLSPMAAEAQSLFDRLVIPGDLIEGHAKYQSDCKNCHEPFSKSSQTKLCLDCHKKVAGDRSQRRGFHGLRTDAVKADCNHCHSEHKGRDADIVQFDRETFSHDFTDFRLRGAHRSARCESCHKSETKFRDAPGGCYDCHKKDDPHKGRLGQTCQDCHSEDSWRRVKPYDHSKTKFPLIGSHKKVKCATCHAGERYKDVPTDCLGCHQLQDVHKGRYGKKCDSCHQPEKWDKIRFDHARETIFPLRGKHATIKCDNCHKGDLYRDKQSTTCGGCHKEDDPHRGQLGVQCQNCHNEKGWRQKVDFDHDLTHFPLIGLHALVLCEECHRTPSFRDTSTKCVDCHKDTFHGGRLGANCSTCHNPNGWELWRFDHATQTSYPLTGAHQRLNCHLCHRETNVDRISLSTACYSCHSSDDVHRGSFGTACNKCHTTDTFKLEGLRQ